MDPHIYCTETLNELRAADGEPAADPDGLLRWMLLTDLARQRLSEDEFVAELMRLRLEATRSRRPALEAAARAVLCEWRAWAQRHAVDRGRSVSPRQLQDAGTRAGLGALAGG
ncbi:MAG TPA: hypothetical protein VF061_00175 [Gemmatimonadales bacterium]